MSLYERVEAQPGGAEALAEARLRCTAQAVVYQAWEGRSLPWRARWALRRGGRHLTVSKLAELLHQAGVELDVTVVPAGELRRRAVPDSWRDDWDSPEDEVYDKA